MSANFECLSQNNLNLDDQNARMNLIRHEAKENFREALAKGRLYRFLSFLVGKSTRLYDLNKVRENVRIMNSYSIGTISVPINQIGGSEGRCDDFDNAFLPRQTHTRSRWINVSMHYMLDNNPPIVELVRVKDVYFVRDGHHRISVARISGQKFIDAQVNAWDVTGVLPWEMKCIDKKIRSSWVQKLAYQVKSLGKQLKPTLAGR